MKIGDKVPDFTLPNHDGTKVSLYSLLADKPLVLFFYPKDHSPGCTKQVCAFRDSYEVFKDAGAEVVGISSDGHDTHLNFAQKHRLPYPLLSDKIGRVRKLMGVPKTLGIMPGRVTYVLDKDATVLHIFNDQFSFAKHVDESLKIVNALQSA